MVSEHSVKVLRAAGNLFLKNFKSKYIQEIIGLRMLALDGVNRLLFQQSVLQLCRGFDLDQTQEILSMMQHKPAVIEPLVESVVDKLIVNLYGIAVHLLRQRSNIHGVPALAVLLLPKALPRRQQQARPRLGASYWGVLQDAAKQ